MKKLSKYTQNLSYTIFLLFFFTNISFSQDFKSIEFKLSNPVQTSNINFYSPYFSVLNTVPSQIGISTGTSVSLQKDFSCNFNNNNSSTTIGVYYIEKNNINLVQVDFNTFSLYKKSNFDFFTCLESDIKNATLLIDDKEFVLNKNIINGLWGTTFFVNKDSVSKMFIRIEDNSGKIANKIEIGSIIAIEHGVINTINGSGIAAPISGVGIKVQKLKEDIGEYKTINANSNKFFSTRSNDRGEYELVLPKGSYRLFINKFGYKTIEKDIVLDKSEIIDTSFTLTKITGIMKWINGIVNIFIY